MSTGAGGTWVISPTGERLGTIVTPELPANCAFGEGGPQDTLYRGSNLYLQHSAQNCRSLKQMWYQGKEDTCNIVSWAPLESECRFWD